MTPRLSQRIVAWQRVHGRHGLPWQATRDPYRIWLSEVMLQQTQVATVIPYYERFLERFPDVAALARAPLEHVLECWSGLGYYSRARNLHACARQIASGHGGVFPSRAELLQELPGIGRSTAAAIAVFAHGERVAILDGNVKRVLCRCFGVDGFPGEPAVERGLWKIADAELPVDETLEPYTQGLMDLGATVCTRARPQCAACPLSDGCVALATGRVAALPAARPRRELPLRAVTMLVVDDGERVLLELRPPTGIWGGLWSLPEEPAHEEGGDATDAAAAAVRRRFGREVRAVQALAPFTHAFTHYRLRVLPVRVTVNAGVAYVAEPVHRWMALSAASGAALPRPVKSLLEGLYVSARGRAA